MNGQSGLPVLVGGEILSTCRRNGFVAGDDPLSQPTHGFHAQRQRNDIEQQQITCRVVARQLIGLDGGPQGHDFVGVEIGQRLAAKEIGHGLAHLRHARGAANHDNALHLIAGQGRILERATHGRQAFSSKVSSRRAEILTFDIKTY